MALEAVRESAHRVGQFVALDESGLGIEPTVEADAADPGGESAELRGGRPGSRGPASIERKW